MARKYGVAYLIGPISKDHTHIDDPGFSSLLDAMRWIAALCVVTTHASWRTLLPLGEVQDGSLFSTLFYAMTSFGHQAVIIFFVLSGYLVGGKGAIAVARARFDVRDYLSARAARLYAVLLPAIALTALSDWLSNEISGGTGFHSSAGYNNLDGWTALTNALMLQHLFTPTFGSNTPLWSLSYEFWFYVSFAIFAQAALKSGTARWCYAALGAGLLCLLGTGFIGYSLMWLIGLVAAVAPRYRAGPASVLAAMGFFLAALPSAHFIDQVLPRMASDLFQSAAAGVLLWTLKTSDLAPMIKLKPINAYLASFSYSLYAVHYPLLLLFLTLLGGPASAGGYSMRFALDPTSLGIFLLIVGGCVAYGWLFSLVTERRTKLLRRWIRRIRIRPSAWIRLDVVRHGP
jgi:peptidoglycan/LPS O-acetylase OafA/YrhL